jgi:hypothetical protein
MVIPYELLFQLIYTSKILTSFHPNIEIHGHVNAGETATLESLAFASVWQ